MTFKINAGKKNIVDNKRPLKAARLAEMGKAAILALSIFVSLAACEFNADWNQGMDESSEYGGGCDASGCGTYAPTDPSESETISKTGVYEQDGGTITQDDQTYAATEVDQSGVYVFNGGQFTIDAPSGSIIYCAAMTDGEGNLLTGSFALASGGTLQSI